MAAQLILMNGLALRDEFSCSARATSSLPVPDSPVISTVDGVSATFSMTRVDLLDAPASRPMIPKRAARRRGLRSRRAASAPRERVRACSAFSTMPDLLLVEGLVDVVEGAELERLDRVVDRAVRGDHDHRHVGMLGRQPAKQAHPVQPGHLRDR